jgi:hypothetical protein
MTWLTVALVALATYRLTRLVTADRIAEPVRNWVVERNPGWAGYLVTCDWCLSIWVAPWPAVAAVLWPDNRAVLAALLALSASAVTGLLSLVERRWDV